MSFDFDAVIDRRGGDSTKWNKYADRDVIPLWVADMDFAAPPALLEALQQRVKHGVFGYGQPWPSLVDAVIEHLEREYAWSVKEEWLVWLPGLVAGLDVACRTAGDAGDTVFTATPIYPPFLSAPNHARRHLASAALVRNDSLWQWDVDATDQALQQSRAKMLLLCHPIPNACHRAPAPRLPGGAGRVLARKETADKSALRNTVSPASPTVRQATLSPATSPGSHTSHSSFTGQAYSRARCSSTASTNDGQGWP